jgi:2-polyprenyl-6-methoxyphenol hydroxylase-like FAD-dependent oxidoreductase
MLAARVLADHFESVTLVERDRLPEGPEDRRGVPQGRHVHVLLMRGQLILEQLFPGLVAGLCSAGAELMDLSADISIRGRQGWQLRFPSGITLIGCSRSLLEWGVRQRVATHPGVSIMAATTVTGLIQKAGGHAITGVRVRRDPTQGEGSAPEEQLEADLVVDATGRGSRAPQWLEALGFPRPPETVVDAFVGYASRIYRRDNRERDWKALLSQANSPHFNRAGVLFPLEGDRWLVSLAGLGRDYPPTEESGFLEFVRSLPIPAMYETIRDAEPLSPTFGQRATENRVRHYERLSNWPDGLIVLGDAACAFNPVFGQGITTAALDAMLLDTCLGRQERHHRTAELTGLGARFQKRLAKLNSAPWLLATSEDLRVRETVGASATPRTRFMHRYLDQVTLLTTKRRSTARTFMEVVSMIKAPPALFRPGILVPALIGMAASRKASPGPSETRVPDAPGQDSKSERV